MRKYQRKRSSTKAVPKKVKQYVRKAIAGSEETKYLDVPISGTASSTTFYGLALTNAIAQGVSRSNRIGAKIKVLGMRYLVEVDPGDNQNVVRLLMLRYRPGGTGGTTISAISSLQGAINTDTYSPYLDKIHEARFAPVDGSTSATVSINRYYRGYIRVGRVLNFGVGTSSVQNSIFLQFHSDSAIAPNPGVQGFVRIYFKDA